MTKAGDAAANTTWQSIRLVEDVMQQQFGHFAHFLFYSVTCEIGVICCSNWATPFQAFTTPGVFKDPVQGPWGSQLALTLVLTPLLLQATCLTPALPPLGHCPGLDLDQWQAACK